MTFASDKDFEADMDAALQVIIKCVIFTITLSLLARDTWRAKVADNQLARDASECLLPKES